MTYKYTCGNEIIKVFMQNDDFHNKVSVEYPKHGNYMIVQSLN